MVDVLITGGTVITMDPERRVIPDGGVAVEKSRILDVGDSKRLRDSYSADREIDARRMIVMPGLLDAHAHAGHSLLRGLGMHAGDWEAACEAVYAHASTEEFWLVDGLLLNLERLKFGTTCGVTFMGGGDSVMRIDDPAYAELHCDAAERVGIRELLAVGPRKPPHPRTYTQWSGKAKREVKVSFPEQIRVSEEVIERRHRSAAGRVNIAVMFPTPHPEKKPITGEELRELKEEAAATRALSREHGLLFTMDGHSRGTIKFCHEELGLLGPDALFSHSTDLTEEEIRLVAETGTRIAHNPSAVASMLGRCPATELIDAGAVVALGSDAGGPDRSFDMFRHMFQAGRYHRRHFRDDRVLPPGKVLEMATIDAAKALGAEKDLGSLEEGKKADIILLNVHQPHLAPFNLPVDRVTCFASGSDVDTVIVDGEILMEHREVRTVDEAEILDRAQEEIEAAVVRSGLKNLYDAPAGYWGKSRY